MKKQIVCLGPKGSYGHCVAEWVNERHFCNEADIVFVSGNKEVLCRVDDGPEYRRVGVVPIYNSTNIQSIVPEVMRFFLSRDNQATEYLLGRHPIRQRLQVTDRISLRVHHQLLVLEPNVSMGEIRTVKSHPQGLGQCAYNLTQLGDIALESVLSTSGAAKMVAEAGDRSMAAISSSFCARLYNLHTLKKDFEDDTQGNYTHFYLVEKMRGNRLIRGSSKVVILLWPKQNKPGVLHKITEPMDSAGINMTYQTTILTGGGVDGEIVFFMEIEIHKNPLVMDAVLILLAEMSKKMVVLGSFTREDVIDD